MNYRIFSIGENALTIDFGNRISARLNDQVLALAARIAETSFPGFVETVPAYSSLTIFYDLQTVRRKFAAHESAFSAVKNFVESILNDLPATVSLVRRTMRIPVCYDQEFAPDLGTVAQRAEIELAEVVRLHAAQTYRVFMLGFLPGFAYLGEVDARIAAPRRPSPRAAIAKGSVGIAGRQTGIYPLESPGGWQIIGRTPRAMFCPERQDVSLLQIGDAVEFYPISRAEFDDHKHDHKPE